MDRRKDSSFSGIDCWILTLTLLSLDPGQADAPPTCKPGSLAFVIIPEPERSAGLA
jgi:hypothetical protein